MTELRTRPVTEEEANGKICPFASSQQRVHCVGRACMLWRWTNYGTTGDRVNPTGFCGAGGDPS